MKREDVKNLVRELILGESTEVAELEKALHNFDWNYDMSDDYRVWQRGEKRRVEIQKMIDSMDQKLAAPIVNKHNKKHKGVMQFNVSGQHKLVRKPRNPQVQQPKEQDKKFAAKLDKWLKTNNFGTDLVLSFVQNTGRYQVRPEKMYTEKVPSELVSLAKKYDKAPNMVDQARIILSKDEWLSIMKGGN